MRPNRAWIAAAAALPAVAAVAVAIGRFWSTIGGGEISLVGWLAMAGGVILGAGLGMGLIALMFFSSRHGYDDAQRQDGESLPPAPVGNSNGSTGTRGRRANC
jgi:hypothetical protein